jgi:hypothetical protein
MNRQGWCHMVSSISVPYHTKGKIFIRDPGFISDPESNKKRGGKICCFTSFVVTNFTKLKMILFLNS